MNSNAKVRVEFIHDREGDGFCGACQREGLRWVVQLSDGSMVGLECAKAVLGFRPAPKAYKWVEDFRLVGTVSNPYETLGWWERKDGKAGAVTVNGVLKVTGPVEWAKNEFRKYAA